MVNKPSAMHSYLQMIQSSLQAHTPINAFRKELNPNLKADDVYTAREKGIKL